MKRGKIELDSTQSDVCSVISQKPIQNKEKCNNIDNQLDATITVY